MKRTLSFLALATVATALTLLPGTANAQVAFGGTFRGPHGSFSVGVGPFVPQAGAYVPDPYAEEISLDPNYGYGFHYDSEWVPCRPYGSGWIIAGSPIVVYGGVRDDGYRSFGYTRPYSGRDFDRDDSARRFDRGDSARSFDRHDSARGFDQNDSARSYNRNDSARSFGRNDSARGDSGRRDGSGRSDNRWSGRR